MKIYASSPIYQTIYVNGKLQSEPEFKTCLRCDGAGTISGMGGSGPDTYEIDVECSECGGTGVQNEP